jgi:hypothetical protein
VRSKIVTIEVWPDSESARPVSATIPRRYQLHPGTRFLARAMAGDPAPPITERGTCRRRDKSVSFGLRPSEIQINMFALVSSSVKLIGGKRAIRRGPVSAAPRGIQRGRINQARTILLFGRVAMARSRNTATQRVEIRIVPTGVEEASSTYFALHHNIGRSSRWDMVMLLFRYSVSVKRF